MINTLHRGMLNETAALGGTLDFSVEVVFFLVFPQTSSNFGTFCLTSRHSLRPPPHQLNTVIVTLFLLHFITNACVKFA